MTANHPNADYYGLLFLRTGVHFAPAAKCRLLLGAKISLCENQAFGTSESFLKTASLRLVNKKSKNRIDFADPPLAEKRPIR